METLSRENPADTERTWREPSRTRVNIERTQQNQGKYRENPAEPGRT